MYKLEPSRNASQYRRMLRCLIDASTRTSLTASSRSRFFSAFSDTSFSAYSSLSDLRTTLYTAPYVPLPSSLTILKSFVRIV